jgi:hypothetical protein
MKKNHILSTRMLTVHRFGANHFPMRTGRDKNQYQRFTLLQKKFFSKIYYLNFHIKKK